MTSKVTDAEDEGHDVRDDLSLDPTPAANEPIDPVAMARRDLQKTLPRRFYKKVEVAAQDGGFGPVLDGKPVRTPAKGPLVVPTAALAEAVATEWAGQGEIITPGTMPLTRLVNSALDGVARTIVETAAETAKFAESDLVCYRAADPATLVAAQEAAWDPVLDFARRTFGATFVCTQAALFVTQPEPSLAAIRAAVAAIADGPAGALRLAALSVMTSLTGSVLMALAVAHGAMTADTAFAAASVDEDYQMRHWGADEEALARLARRREEMLAAAKVYALAG